MRQVCAGRRKEMKWVVSYSYSDPDFNGRVSFEQEEFDLEKDAKLRACDLKGFSRLQIKGKIYENISVKEKVEAK